MEDNHLSNDLALIVLAVCLLPVQSGSPCPARSQRPSVLDAPGGARGDYVAIRLSARRPTGNIVRGAAVNDVPR